MSGRLFKMRFRECRLCLMADACDTILSGLAARASSAPWLPFGPDGGDARRFAADPRDASHLFVGTATGWIFESRNGGTNWKRLAQVGKRDDLVIDNLIVDPVNPKHLIVGAWAIDHPDGGLFTSTDGGLTWLNQAEMRGQSIRALAESSSDPKVFVAGSLQGVFRSDDGGQRWHRISPVDKHRNPRSRVGSPSTRSIRTSSMPGRGICPGRRQTGGNTGTISRKASSTTPMCFQSSSIPRRRRLFTRVLAPESTRASMPANVLRRCRGSHRRRAERAFCFRIRNTWRRCLRAQPRASSGQKMPARSGLGQRGRIWSSMMCL